MVECPRYILYGPILICSPQEYVHLFNAGGAIKGCAKRGARGAGVAPARLEAERALTRGHELYPGVARRQQDRVAVFGEEFNGRVIVLFLPRALNDVPACSYGSGALAG